MSLTVLIYGSFICTCGQTLRNFTAIDGTRTLKCQNAVCPHFDEPYSPPSIDLQPK